MQGDATWRLWDFYGHSGRSELSFVGPIWFLVQPFGDLFHCTITVSTGRSITEEARIASASLSCYSSLSRLEFLLCQDQKRVEGRSLVSTEPDIERQSRVPAGRFRLAQVHNVRRNSGTIRQRAGQWSVSL